MNPKQFRLHVVRPTLLYLGLHSAAAENLLVGTAVHESGGLEALDQITGAGDVMLGPAYGVFQIEPATHEDQFATFLNRKKYQEIKKKVVALSAIYPSATVQLATTLCYATAIARIKYYRDPEPLPTAGDLLGLARYWKRVYNTSLGAGTVKKFINDCRVHGAWDGADVVPVVDILNPQERGVK